MDGSAMTIITGILTFLGGSGFVKLVDYLKNRTNKKHLEKLAVNLQDLSKIYRIIEKILDQSTANRVLILRASNGGGIPKPGSEMFIKLLYAATVKEDLAIYDKYSSIKIDGQFIDMLIDIQKNGQTVKKTEDMTNSLLKRIQQSEGIKYSEIYFLTNNAHEMYYCAISSIKEGEEFADPMKKIAIELGINDLRKIFIKHMS